MVNNPGGLRDALGNEVGPEDQYINDAPPAYDEGRFGENDIWAMMAQTENGPWLHDLGPLVAGRLAEVFVERRSRLQAQLQSISQQVERLDQAITWLNPPRHNDAPRHDVANDPPSEERQQHEAGDRESMLSEGQEGILQPIVGAFDFDGFLNAQDCNQELSPGLQDDRDEDRVRLEHNNRRPLPGDMEHTD
jgi:hypothetical protein